MRAKLCVFLFFFLLLPLGLAPARADVVLQRGDSVPNLEPGYCTWCSLETLANAIKRKAPDDPSVKAMIGLRGRREKSGGGPATPDIVRRQLSELGVKFQERNQILDDYGRPIPGRSKDLEFLKDACQRDVGAMVGVYNFPKPGSWHALAVLSISKDKEVHGGRSDYQVCFYDPNVPENLCYWSLTDFTTYWTGWTVAIDLTDRPAVASGPTIKQALPRVSPLEPKDAPKDIPKDVEAGPRLPAVAPPVLPLSAKDSDLWSKIEADMAALKKEPKAALPPPRSPVDFTAPKTHDELVRFLERTGLTPQEALRAAGNLVPGGKKGD